ncbi:MAG: hypothetical protein Q7T44_13750 [Parvibaculum sp.]|nr:hypothetical protein [Parvibaculum sp.]
MQFNKKWIYLFAIVSVLLGISVLEFRSFSSGNHCDELKKFCFENYMADDKRGVDAIQKVATEEFLRVYPVGTPVQLIIDNFPQAKCETHWEIPKNFLLCTYSLQKYRLRYLGRISYTWAINIWIDGKNQTVEKIIVAPSIDVM